jgi:hypothetical protein
MFPRKEEKFTKTYREERRLEKLCATTSSKKGKTIPLTATSADHNREPELKTRIFPLTPTVPAAAKSVHDTNSK